MSAKASMGGHALNNPASVFMEQLDPLVKREQVIVAQRASRRKDKLQAGHNKIWASGQRTPRSRMSPNS